MPATITNLLDRIQREHTHLDITLYPPATEAELLAFEQHKGLRLPADVRAFYRFCNGLELNDEMLRIIPLSEIMEGCSTSELVAPASFTIAELLIYCDMWELTINPLNPEDYIISNESSMPTTLTASFSEFLEVVAYNGAYGQGGLLSWEARLTRQQLNRLYTDLANSTRVVELDQAAERTRQEFNWRYNAESVKFVEQSIESTKASSLPPEEWPGLINALGAFLGRCIIRNYGGSWQTDKNSEPCVVFNEQHQVFPLSEVAKQFANGPEYSVYSFYTAIPTVFNRPFIGPNLTGMEEWLNSDK